MSRKMIEEKVNFVLSEEFEVEKEMLVPESSIKEDLSLDSLDAVDLIVMLEEELSIDVDPQLFMECKTLGDIYSVIEKINSGEKED